MLNDTTGMPSTKPDCGESLQDTQPDFLNKQQMEKEGNNKEKTEGNPAREATRAAFSPKLKVGTSFSSTSNKLKK